jgi:hypothetical protein
VRGVFTVFEQDGPDAGVAFEYMEEFGSAIATISDDAGEGVHVYSVL